MQRNKNITLNLKNITSHFTGKAKIITLVFTIIMLSFVNITLGFSNIFSNSNVSALSYQGNAEVKFTFNPTLSINISSSDLIIDNLTPGTTSDSNVINVSVATNASHGYTLAATVGDSLHNNTNLTHANGNNIFSSIATDASLSSLATDNTWGYSYRLSTNNNNNSNNSNSDTGNSSDSNTWSNYSGLSNETSKTLVNTDSQLAKPIDFKIAAKASSTQASGTYANTINFIAISKPIPKTIEDIAYMQTFGELLPTDLQTVKDSMEEEHTYILKDARDEQDYTIAKLKDGKIWMTKNLNLAGGVALYSETSNIPDGYEEDGNIPYYILPSSSTGWSGDENVYNSNSVICTTNQSCYSYYSWPVATVMSGSDIANNTNAPYSVCPKGWELPTSIDGSFENSDFYHLITSYGVAPEDIGNSSSETAKNFYLQAGSGTTPNFLLTGQYYSSIVNVGRDGNYWSSTRRQSTTSYYMNFSSNKVSSQPAAGNGVGFAVRCLAR